MNKKIKIVILSAIFMGIAIVLCGKVEAAEYIWPIGGANAYETGIDYEFYGSASSAPVKNGKSGREYIVNNTKWPKEQYYYSRSESHFGTDIAGVYGSTYNVVSVCKGTVIATSADRSINEGISFVDRNQRRTQEGLKDGGGYGNYIVIQEESTGRCFLYAHLKANTIKLKKGNTVNQGQQIAVMGSSGDSGHTHLHFEIRTSKANCLNENKYGKHTIVPANSNTNLDPMNYVDYVDGKRVKLTNNQVEAYIKYLYRNVLGREADSSGLKHWIDKYNETGSIAHITRGIMLSAKYKDNFDFIKNTYKILLVRKDVNSGTFKVQTAGHLDKLNKGIWRKEYYLNMICNSDEFVNTRIKQIINTEVVDSRRVKLSDAEVKVYIKYLYRNVLGRVADSKGLYHWLGAYKDTGSIAHITKGIMLSAEAKGKNTAKYSNNKEFVKMTYEILLVRKNCNEQEYSGHVIRLNEGIWSKESYLNMICNSDEFVNTRIKQIINK